MNKYKNKKAGEMIIKTYDEMLKTWGTPVKEIDLPTTYGTIHIIEAGVRNGKPLVLFHGVGDDSAFMWMFNAKGLAEHYHLYAIDTIGGPGKTMPGEKYNKEFSDLLLIDEILDKLKLEKTSIAGVSNGGYLVQLYTSARPERIEKSISISCAASSGKGKGSPMKMIKIFFPEAFFPSRKNAAKLLRKLAGDNYRVFTDNALILEHNYWLLKGFNNRSMFNHHVRYLTKEENDIVRERTFFLLGEEDPFEKLGGRDQVIKLNMNAKFYKGAGHGLNHEMPDEINAMIIDIMEGRVQNIRNY